MYDADPFLPLPRTLPLAAAAAGCTALRCLDLGACVRLKGPCLLDLAASPAVQVRPARAHQQRTLLLPGVPRGPPSWQAPASTCPTPSSTCLQLGCLEELRLADLAWVRPAQLGPLLQALARDCDGLTRLDLSSAGGLIDGVLAALESCRLPGGQVGSPLLQELRLAHASRLTPTALGSLAGSGLLSRLREVDVAHVQCLGRSSSSAINSGSGSSSAPSEGSPAAQALPAMFQAAGGSLRTAVLDGCWAGGGLLPLLARCCPGVERLSLVGCSGIGDADLQALSSLRGLSDLSVGGASLAWHEHRALTGAQRRAGVVLACHEGHCTRGVFYADATACLVGLLTHPPTHPLPLLCPCRADGAHAPAHRAPLLSH